MLKSPILLVTHKKNGAVQLNNFLREEGLESKIVGKGRGGVRLIEVEKTSVEIQSKDTTKEINFSFNGCNYSSLVDDCVFSKEGLDKGTEFLLEEVLREKTDLNKKRIGDLGSGWGAISIVVLTEFPEAEVLVIEKDLRSYEVSKKNLEKFGERAVSKKADLAIYDQNNLKEYSDSIDYIIFNPPFHVTDKERGAIFKNAKKLLKKRGGVIAFVVEKSFAGRFADTAKNFF